MSDQESNRSHPLLFIFSLAVLLLVTYLILHHRSDLKSAQADERKGDYAEAYQLYAKTLMDCSKGFEASDEDFKKWVAKYINFLLAKPTHNECAEACSRFSALENS